MEFYEEKSKEIRVVLNQTNNNDRKMQTAGYLMLSFLICLIPRLLFLKEVYPLSVTGDETFMFMPAATWAGLDWSGNAGSYRYYGYGFVALLTPLFKYIESPVVLYRVIVGFMILFQALVGPISYHIMKKYFSMKNNLLTVAVSVACSYLVFLRAVYAYNEFIYDLFVWLIFWCLLELLQNQKNKVKKAVLTGVLMVLLVYEMTIHSRAVALWIALAVTVLFYLWVYRRCILSIPVTFILGGIGYFFSQKGIDYIVNMFTNAASSSEIGNTSVSFSISSIFTSAKAGIGWIYIVLGQINSMLLVTGGVAIIGATIGCHMLWKSLFRKKEIVEGTYLTRNYFLVFTFGLAASAITILGQAFSWLPGVIQTIESGQATDGMRAVTYLRYYGIYFVPVSMLGIVWCVQNKNKLRAYLIPIGLITLVLEGFWTVFIVPYISDFNGTSWDSNVFSLTKGWEDTIRIRSYFPAIAITVIFLAVFCVLILKRKYTLSTVLLCVLLVYSYGFNCIYHEGERGQINYSYVDKSYEIFQKLKGQAVPEELYVDNTSFPETGQSLVSQCQFMLKDEKIIAGIPWNAEKTTIFITCDPRENTHLLKNGFLCAQLDKNEYWYVKGEKVQDALKSMGIELTTYLKNKSEIPLTRVASDVKVRGNGFAYMDSNGEEGNFVYGYSMPFSGGVLEVEMDMEAFSWENEVLGSLQIWRNDSLFQEEMISADEIDENSRLKIQMEIETCEAESIEPRIYLNYGSNIRLNEITFERKTNQYTLGQDLVETLSKTIEKFTEKVPQIGYYTSLSTDGGNVDELEIKAGGSICKTQSTDMDILLAADTRENLLDLTKEYSLYKRFAEYDLWMRRNLQKESDYSSQYGILADLFRTEEKDIFSSNHGIQLPAGEYTVTHIVEDGNLSAEHKVQIYCYGELLEKRNVPAHESMNGIAVLQYQIKVPEDSEWEFILCSPEKFLYKEKIYIKKL